MSLSVEIVNVYSELTNTEYEDKSSDVENEASTNITYVVVFSSSSSASSIFSIALVNSSSVVTEIVSTTVVPVLSKYYNVSPQVVHV